MFLLRDFTTPNGITTQFHVIRRIETRMPSDALTVHVQSFASQAAFATSENNPSWNTPVVVPLTAIAAPLVDSIVEWLTLDVGSPFMGAQYLPASSASLDEAKLRKRAEINVAREAGKSAPLVTPYGTFDADKEARDNIADTYALLSLVVSRGGADSTDFTLYDNSVVQLTLSQLGDVALMLGQQVQTAYGMGRVLKGQIDDAETIEEVEVITWPT